MRKIILLAIAFLAIQFVGDKAFSYSDFHHSIPKMKKNYDSLFINARPIDQSREGQNLIDSCLKRYGGVEKLNELHSFTLETSMITSFLHSDTIKIVKSFEPMRRYRISKKSDSTYESRILNGDKAWFLGRDTLIELVEDRYKAELFSYLTLTMPLGMKSESFSEIKYGLRDGDSLAYIYMKKSDSLMIVIGIDPHDYFIKSSEGIIYGVEGDFVFINKFGNFKEVTGYIFPHYIVNISMGLEVGRSEVINIEVNKPLDAVLFQPDNSLSHNKGL